jgi:hypothetical protein
MSKDQVSVKLSPELRQHLKAYKATQGKRSLKAAVVEILGSHFHLTQLPSQPSAIDSSIERIASLEAKVTYLSEQLEALRQAIATPAAPATTTPKSTVESSASSTASHTPSETTSTDDLDDDMYDEPDEILYNFLEP